MEYRHSAFACVQCGHVLNASGSIDGSYIPEPSDGDFCLCLACGAPMRYAIKRRGRKRVARLVAVTEADLASVHPDNLKELHEAQQKIFAVMFEQTKGQRPN